MSRRLTFKSFRVGEENIENELSSAWCHHGPEKTGTSWTDICQHDLWHFFGHEFVIVKSNKHIFNIGLDKSLVSWPCFITGNWKAACEKGKGIKVKGLLVRMDSITQYPEKIAQPTKMEN